MTRLLRGILSIVLLTTSMATPVMSQGTDRPAFRAFLSAPIFYSAPTGGPQDPGAGGGGALPGGTDEDDEASGPPGAGTNDPDAYELSRRTEFGSQSCGVEYDGLETRSREIVVMSNGVEIEQPWSAWSRSDCVAKPYAVSTSVETGSSECGTGYTGQQSRTRTITTMSSGPAVTGAWSAWDRTACQAVVVTSTSTETGTQACEAGYTGSQKRTRSVTNYSDGSVAYGTWSSWNKSSCSPTIVETMTRKSYSIVACGGSSGYRVQITSTPRHRYANGTEGNGTVTVNPGTCRTNSTLVTYSWDYGSCSLFRQGRYSKTEYWVNRHGEMWETDYDRMTAGCVDAF